MSETKKRNTHLPEFKAKVGLEAVRGVKTVNQIAQEHGVHPVQVSQWKKEIQAQAKTLFEGKRGPQAIAAHSAPDRLYGEIGRLKMELDWLKKKSGIESACERAMQEGVYSYGHVKTLTERLMEEALTLLDAPTSSEGSLTQNHALIRAGDDYADLFTLGAQQSATLASTQAPTRLQTQAEAPL